MKTLAYWSLILVGICFIFIGTANAAVSTSASATSNEKMIATDDWYLTQPEIKVTKGDVYGHVEEQWQNPMEKEWYLIDQETSNKPIPKKFSKEPEMVPFRKSVEHDEYYLINPFEFTR